MKKILILLLLLTSYNTCVFSGPSPTTPTKKKVYKLRGLNALKTGYKNIPIIFTRADEGDINTFNALTILEQFFSSIDLSEYPQIIEKINHLLINDTGSHPDLIHIILDRGVINDPSSDSDSFEYLEPKEPRQSALITKHGKSISKIKINPKAFFMDYKNILQIIVKETRDLLHFQNQIKYSPSINFLILTTGTINSRIDHGNQLVPLETFLDQSLPIRGLSKKAKSIIKSILIEHLLRHLIALEKKNPGCINFDNLEALVSGFKYSGLTHVSPNAPSSLNIKVILFNANVPESTDIIITHELISDYFFSRDNGVYLTDIFNILESIRILYYITIPENANPSDFLYLHDLVREALEIENIPYSKEHIVFLNKLIKLLKEKFRVFHKENSEQYPISVIVNSFLSDPLLRVFFKYYLNRATERGCTLCNNGDDNPQTNIIRILSR